MKRILSSLLSATGLAPRTEPPAVEPPRPDPAQVMADMRARALAIRPADIGLSPADYADRPWGLLMETGLERGATFSLVVLADGTTSIYFSSGGGIIGAGQHPAVRSAAVALLELAAAHRADMAVTTTTPLPQTGQVRFHALDPAGTLTYAAEEQALGEKRDRLWALFHAGHAVVTQVRMAEQAREQAQGR